MDNEEGASMASWFLLSCPYANRVGSGCSRPGSSEETYLVPLFSSDTWLGAFGCHLLSSYWKMSAEESLFLIMGRKRQQREKWCLWSASMLLQVLSLQGLQGLQSSSQADVIQETSTPCQLGLQGSINWKNDSGPIHSIPCLLYSLVLFEDWYDFIAKLKCMCLYACVCVYVPTGECSCVCMCMSVNLCVHVCMLLCVHALVCVCLCVHTSLCLCVHVPIGKCSCMWLCMSMSMCVCLHVFVCVHAPVCAYVCTCFCMCLCMHSCGWVAKLRELYPKKARPGQSLLGL